MLTSILIGTVAFCSLSIADVIISNKINTSRIEGKMEERNIYESNPSPTNPVEKEYDVEEI